MLGSSSDFLDAMYANFFLPYIIAPSRVTAHSKTLINNIFLNTVEDGSSQETLSQRSLTITANFSL